MCLLGGSASSGSGTGPGSSWPQGSVGTGLSSWPCESTIGILQSFCGPAHACPGLKNLPNVITHSIHLLLILFVVMGPVAEQGVSIETEVLMLRRILRLWATSFHFEAREDCAEPQLTAFFRCGSSYYILGPVDQLCLDRTGLRLLTRGQFLTLTLEYCTLCVQCQEHGRTVPSHELLCGPGCPSGLPCLKPRLLLSTCAGIMTVDYL